MTIMFILFGSAVALELFVHIFGRARRVRRVLAMSALIIGAFAAGAFVASKINVFSVVLGLLSLYRMFNMVRVIEERMHEQYLRRATRRTSLMLILLQLALLFAWWAWNTWHATGHTVWAVVATMQLIGAGILLVSTARNLVRTRWPVVTKHYSDKELPTVTVAIPARNETEDLQQCLQSLIASDYPKLEIIVLDDCSQLKRTPQIIREFAHAGVRFVQGEQPSDTWLPKNQAYDRLVREATGQYLLFCGVDIRFAPDSVRKAIATMLARDKQMLSLLPQRPPRAYGYLSLIQAMRYWWEIAPPRRLFNRPPVLSSCWIITSAALKEAGGFRAVARSITPEAHFARLLARTDGYSFLRSGDILGIESNKQIHEQRDTAVRMRYPQVHRRPEQVAIISLLEAFFLLLPFGLAIAGFWISIGQLGHVAAIVASILLCVAYLMISRATRVDMAIFGAIAQPLAVLVDLVLLHYSMWRYELSTVEWKGRNVCIPVMHVVPHLPKSDR